MTTCARSRRLWLQTASMAGLSWWTSPLWQPLFAAATPAAKARACILIFLDGGPSQIDTFDPKPGTPNGGPVEAIATKLEGMKFSQYLPKMAEIADRLAVIRSLNSREGDHERAVRLLHTGYAPTPRLEHPSLGCSIARHLHHPDADVPAFVTIGNTIGPGILGPQFGPFTIQDTKNPASALELPEGMTESRVRRRVRALEKFNREFDNAFESSLGADLTQLTRQADQMRRNAVFRPFDPETEDPQLFARYRGATENGELARACIAARRFIEAGVRFVEIQYAGWDTHEDNFNQVKELCRGLDAAFATLIIDLAQRGLLEDTLVVCVGEFGRTPKINGNNGRDHFPDVFSVVLAGGGLNVGQVIGASTADGMEICDRAVSVPDFHATLFAALGFDVTRDHFAPDGRLLRLTNGGVPLSELIATA